MQCWRKWCNASRSRMGGAALTRAAIGCQCPENFACNSPADVSTFEIRTLEFCGFWGAARYSRQGIACEIGECEGGARLLCPRLCLCVEVLHPIRRQCTRSDWVQHPVRGAASRNGCSAGCGSCCVNRGGACDSEVLRYFGEQCTRWGSIALDSS